MTALRINWAGELDAVRAMRLAGKSRREIASIYGVTQSVIDRMLVSHGLTATRRSDLNRRTNIKTVANPARTERGLRTCIARISEACAVTFDSDHAGIRICKNCRGQIS